MSIKFKIQNFSSILDINSDIYKTFTIKYIIYFSNTTFSKFLPFFLKSLPTKFANLFDESTNL